MHAYTYIHTYIHTYIQLQHTFQTGPTPKTWAHTHTHTYMHTYIYTYMHTYIHTYMHIYIHTAAAYPPNWPNAQNVGTYIPSNTGPYFVTGQSFGQTETEITREKESENGANSGNAAARRKTPKWEQRVKKFFGAAEKEEEDAGLK